MGINIGAFLGQLICPIIGDVKDSGGIRDIHAFKWGFLAASIAMVLGTIIFAFLKNKYVVTPEGKPLGGLPSKRDSSDFEEGESEKAVRSVRGREGVQNRYGRRVLQRDHEMAPRDVGASSHAKPRRRLATTAPVWICGIWTR